MFSPRHLAKDSRTKIRGGGENWDLNGYERRGLSGGRKDKLLGVEEKRIEGSLIQSKLCYEEKGRLGGTEGLSVVVGGGGWVGGGGGGGGVWGEGG